MTLEASNAAVHKLINILRVKDDLPVTLRRKFDKQVIKLTTKLTEETEVFLHHLDIEQHSEKSVRATLQAFPEALYQINEKDRLPIQQACYSDKSSPFIPLLAEEGNKLHVRGAGNRGGLLLNLPGEEKRTNILQLLSNWNSKADPIACDSTSTSVLKKLERGKLLKTKDVKRYNLLSLASFPSCKQRFRHLVKMSPEALKGNRSNSDPLLKVVVSHGDIDRFAMVLKAGMDYYPEEAGLLFRRKNDDDKNACDLAFKLFSRKEIMDCLPSNTAYQHYTRIFRQYFDA